MRHAALSDEDLNFAQLAETAAKRAYSPFSHFKVGALVVAESGKTYAGCNVENGSYGLTICAERAAVFNGVSAEGPSFRIKDIYIVSLPPRSFPPCGACLQVINEFATPATHLTFNYGGKLRKYPLREALPYPFITDEPESK